MEITKERLIELAKDLATPIDIDRLVEDGVLEKSVHGWYAVNDMQKLPIHAWKQVVEAKSEAPSGKNRNYFKFEQGNAAAAKLYEHLTGTPFSA